MSRPLLTLPRLAAALPAVFLLHVAEEGPGFVPWFNSLAAPPISQRLFLSVNAVALLITLAVALFVVASRDRASALAGVAWVGFLMPANAAFHVVATVVHGRYCPGVITLFSSTSRCPFFSSAPPPGNAASLPRPFSPSPFWVACPWTCTATS